MNGPEILRRIDPASFGAVLAALWSAHDLADHVVQTDHQAANKARDFEWKAPMAGHVGGYTAVQLGALLALRALAGVRPTWGRTAAGVAFSALSHALLDRRWPVVRILELTGSPGFARSNRVPHHQHDWTVGDEVGPDRMPPLPLHGPYLADQALHHACLAAAAALIAGPNRVQGAEKSRKQRS